MKINREQLLALANQLDNELFAPARAAEVKANAETKKNAALLPEDKKVLAVLGKAFKLYNDHYKKVYEEVYPNSNIGDSFFIKNQESNLKSLRKAAYKSKASTIPTKQDVIDALTVATIDAKNVEELIKAIKAKYKVK